MLFGGVIVPTFPCTLNVVRTRKEEKKLKNQGQQSWQRKKHILKGLVLFLLCFVRIDFLPPVTWPLYGLKKKSRNSHHFLLQPLQQEKGGKGTRRAFYSDRKETNSTHIPQERMASTCPPTPTFSGSRRRKSFPFVCMYNFPWQKTGSKTPGHTSSTRQVKYKKEDCRTHPAHAAMTGGERYQYKVWFPSSI